MQTNQHYTQLLQDLKSRIAQSRYVAARLVNQEQLKLYFNIGKLLDEKITAQKWGDKVLLQIASDLNNEIPNLRGFSHRNLKKMRQFYTAYANEPIGPLLTAQLQTIDNVKDIIGQSSTAQLRSVNSLTGESPTGQSDEPTLHSFMRVTFTHHLLLLNKCKSYKERLFYMRLAADSFWSVDTMEHHIKENFFSQIGKLHNNFDTTIQPDHSQLAIELFKDQYLLDFLQLQDDDKEVQIESSIVSNITEFILKMGKGFAFIGNQFRLDVDGHEFSIDLLFYNRILHRLVAFDLLCGVQHNRSYVV